ncbi:50S ribosomal protein L25 [Planctomycetes bacterium Poly30]|uniref:Large ribosomal subunit protein bL25 n=1 Tax=Saltatorellus ferox TaxID=2528018 RepID=A0A518ER97_9BACT|nr:50S ribosomal protein L25 [Planctomycetes bacterium Poly30]
MTDGKLSCEVRKTLGSRSARRLRAYGRMVASLQAHDKDEHVNLHFDEASFHALRRNHVHLFDLEFDGKSEAAIVGELQWDSFGDTLQHVEFKRVVRGEKTESEVPLKFRGTPVGVLTHDLNEVTILCLPSVIPDAIIVNVDGLEPGTHVKAKDVKLPDGVELVIDPEHDLAVITELRSGPQSDGEEKGEGEGEDA